MKRFKTYIALLLITFTSCVYSQGVLEIEGYEVLYRDFKNIVRVGSTKGQNDFILSSDDCRIEKSGMDWGVTVTSKAKVVDLYILNNSGDTLSKREFLAVSLPDPLLFLGCCTDRDHLYSRSQKKLYVKYTDGIQASCDYNIRNWEISIDGYNKKLKGKGDFLTEEVIKIIGFAPRGAFITIRANSVNTKGKKIRLTSTLRL